MLPLPGIYGPSSSRNSRRVTRAISGCGDGQAHAGAVRARATRWSRLSPERVETARRAPCLPGHVVCKGAVQPQSQHATPTNSLINGHTSWTQFSRRVSARVAATFVPTPREGTVNLGSVKGYIPLPPTAGSDLTFAPCLESSGKGGATACPDTVNLRPVPSGRVEGGKWWRAKWIQLLSHESRLLRIASRMDAASPPV